MTVVRKYFFQDLKSPQTDKHEDTCDKKISPTFRLEGEVAELADVRPDVGVCPDVFLQHAGFLTADAAFLADVFPPTATTNVNIVLVGFVPGRKRKTFLFLSVKYK